MQSGVICGAGRLQWLGIGGRLVLHTLRSGYVPCLLAHWPPPPVRGGGGRESFDYFHRLRLIPGKGHCSLWAAQTKRLPANNSQDTPALPKKSLLTHRPPITQTLIAAEKWPQLCLFYQKWLLMQHRAQLVAIKLKKLPAHLMEAELAISWKSRVHLGCRYVEELQLGGVTTNQPALASPRANCWWLIMQ